MSWKPSPILIATCSASCSLLRDVLNDLLELGVVERPRRRSPLRRELLPHPSDSPVQPCRLNRLEQVVDRVYLERLDRVLVVGGDEHDPRIGFLYQQLARYFEPGPAGI